VGKGVIGASVLRRKKLLVFRVTLVVHFVIVKVQTNVLNVKKDILLTLLQSKIELNVEIVL